MITNTRLILALAIPIGVPMRVVNGKRKTQLPVHEQTGKVSVSIIECCDVIKCFAHLFCH